MGLALVHFQKYWLLRQSFKKYFKIVFKRHLGAVVCHSGGRLHQSGDRKVISRILTGADGDHWVSEKNFFFPILTHHLSLFEGFASSLSVLLQIDSKNKLLCLLLLCTKGQKISKEIFLETPLPKMELKASEMAFGKNKGT